MERPSRLRSLGIAALSPPILCGFALAPGIVVLVVLVELERVPSGAGVWIACLAGVVGLHAWAVFGVLKRRRAPWWPLAGQAVLTVVPMVFWVEWAPVAVLLTATLLVVAERLQSWALVAVAVACGPALVLVLGDPWLVMVPVVGLAEYAVISLCVRAHSLRAVLTDRVCRAVADERHRLTRDLHDLVGHRLTLLILRLELAQRQLEKGGERVREELDEALELARGVTEDVRSVAHLGRSYSLESELRSARSALESGGVRCRVHVRCDSLPQPATRVLAHVLREGVTNILRHTAARECSIRVWQRDGVVRLSMLNDGARHQRRSHGRGLRNLRELAAEQGGGFEARVILHGRFRMSVSIPSKSHQ